ncbi:hypothetical protein LXL04_027706 [Taraxacum kok-saghyz]
METQPPSGNGGGEMRKVHIVYFLSHKGRIDHPHLIRVHHHSRKGVRLRDVKRWLSELRGKDMPESFAWSYKRKYKAGYVWQDLLDEDLITPIADNEYVLKGSEISSISITTDLTSNSTEEEDMSKPKSSLSFKIDIKDPTIPSEKEPEVNSINSSTKTSFEIEELPSFGSETSTEDTTKQQDQEDYQFLGSYKQAQIPNQKKTELNSFFDTFLNKNKNDNTIKKDRNPKETTSSKASPSLNKSFGSMGASHMFLNLITCGIVDTNESAVTVVNRRNSTSSSRTNLDSRKDKNMGQIVKGDKVGGSERISRVHWPTLEQQRESRKEGSKKSHNLNDSNDFKTFTTRYKFVSGAYCAQCGKQFTPEKLYTHMKSCKGMKALIKATKSKLQSC